MARLEREASDHTALDGGVPERWGGAAPPRQDWNRAPNDRLQATDLHLRLADTIERDIIPRLINVHRTAPDPGTDVRRAALRPTAQEVESFVQLVLAREQAAALNFVEVLGRRGMPVETIYLDLLAPASRHLNYLWTEDLCDFTQVTLGLARMQSLMRGLSASIAGEQASRSNARRVLLIPARGEQQTFGLSMVAEFFHHAGWEVDCGAGSPTLVDAAQTVAQAWFDVLGVSAGSETTLDSLKASIRDARQSSRNKSMVVLVGGPMFVGHPERVKFVGADSCGLDGKQAPVHAERLMGNQTPAH